MIKGALTFVCRGALACAMAASLAGCTMHAMGAPGALVQTPAGGSQQPDVLQGGGGGGFVVIHDPNNAFALGGIAAGPDGNMWAINQNNNSVARVQMSTKLKEFVFPTATSGAWGITNGPDGNLWVTEENVYQIAKVTPAGSITEYQTPIKTGVIRYSPGDGIVTGPDNNLWFTLRDGDVAKSTTGGAMTVYALSPGGCAGQEINVGPDHNLWVSTNCSAIDKVTTGGAVTAYNIVSGDVPFYIVNGSDGNMYFSETGGYFLGKITTGGTITEMDSHPCYVYGNRGLVAVGNQIWFVCEGTAGVNQIGRFNVSTQQFMSPLSPPRVLLDTTRTEYFAAGPDGNIWFTNDNADIGVRVQLAITLTPLSATIAPGGQQTITVSETHYAGAWTASSANTGIATVAPGLTANTFTVTGVAAGKVKITISDSKGNSAVVVITVS